MQSTRRKIVSVLGILILLALCPPLPLRASPNAPDKFSTPSPDGNFIFRQTVEWQSEDGDAAFSVVDARTKRSVLIDPGASLPPMESIACIWAPDSKRFAVNARIAARYETTELFEWDGRNFRHIPSIEATITALLAADRNAQLKNSGIPEDTALRHIWDTYKVLKWETPDTLKVLGSSTRSYVTNRDSQATTEIVSAFTFTLKLEKNARPRILAQSAWHPEVSGR